MKDRDANDLAVLILILTVVVLAADGVWLHVRSWRQAGTIAALEQRISRLENPPTISDQARSAYQKTKDAAARGYQSVKDAAVQGYRKVRAGCESVGSENK